jgi:hypothetical protein
MYTLKYYQFCLKLIMFTSEVLSEAHQKHAEVYIISILHDMCASRMQNTSEPTARSPHLHVAACRQRLQAPPASPARPATLQLSRQRVWRQLECRPLARQAMRASTHIMARANVLRRVPGLAHLKQIAV